MLHDWNDVHVRACEFFQCEERVLRPAGNRTAVDERLSRTGDDIVLVSPTESGRIGARRECGADELFDRAELFQQRWEIVFRVFNPGELGDALEQFTGRLRNLDGPFVAPDPRYSFSEFHNRIVVVALRAVSGGALGYQFEPLQALFGGLDQVDLLTAHINGVAADFRNRLARACEHLGVVIDHPAGAVRSAGFFVSEEDHEDVTVRDDVLAHHLSHYGNDHGAAVFHVDGTSAPQKTVLDFAAERVNAPLRGVSGDDIRMPVHDECWAIRIRAFDACHEIGPAGG